jgi:hypothetical protein
VPPPICAPRQRPGPETLSSRWCHFPYIPFPGTLARTQRTLPNLTFHSDEHVGASSGLPLYFRHLCMHSLCAISSLCRPLASSLCPAACPYLELPACKMRIHLDAYLHSAHPHPHLRPQCLDMESSCWHHITTTSETSSRPGLPSPSLCMLTM